mmetsp:Transcript_10959/g.13860  ORF Transcript_10959/g.13860 Transcript_10959/m.13860 type:complete len:405 (+) Transcript_10959:138-1352(+)
MHFTKSALAFVFAVVAGPIAASAFTTPGAAFVSTGVSTKGVVSVTSHAAGCPCSGCASRSAGCKAGCKCLSCGMKTALRMSEEVAAEVPQEVSEDAADEVPQEVKSMDGVASEEEAHNTDRPARDSGIKKHKKGDNSGTSLDDLVIGSFVDGTVKTITSYGCFVDIGAKTDALLHVSRLSDDFVSNVEDVVKAGDSVNVRIVSVDTAKGQVAISMLSQEAEDKAADARKSGGRRKERPQRSGGDRSAQVKTLNELNDKGFDTAKFIEGEVVSTLAFGAFVRFSAKDLVEDVEGELDGLVHISALTAGRANSVEEFAKPGDKVQVRVRGVDVDGNKVSLSMITVEQEAATPKRDNKKGRRGRQMFSADEMGASDWKESLETLQKDGPQFNNAFIVDDKRKSVVSA